MGACMSETTVVTKQDGPIRPKAHMRQSAHRVLAKDRGETGERSQQTKETAPESAIIEITDMDKVETKVHENILTRVDDYSEPWLCSGAQEDDGCQSDSPVFQPGMADKVWICQETAYFLCINCIKHYAKHQQSTLLSAQQQQCHNPQYDEGEEDI